MECAGIRITTVVRVTVWVLRIASIIRNTKFNCSMVLQ